MQPIWLTSYEPGVPHTIDPDRYTSLNAMLEEALQKYKDLPAYTNMGQIISYADLDTKSRLRQLDIGLCLVT